MTFNRFSTVAAFAFAIAMISGSSSARTGETRRCDHSDNASQVEGLVSPGNFILVKQGMTMKIVPTGHLDWPPPYKEATERYSPQVSLASDGELKGYVAGLPFPLVDANDPDAATKIMWNFQFRPLHTDDLDSRGVEAVSHRAARPMRSSTSPSVTWLLQFRRTDRGRAHADGSGRYEDRHRVSFGRISDPRAVRDARGRNRQRALRRPGFEDAVWEYSSETRRLRRLPATQLSDTFGVAI